MNGNQVIDINLNDILPNRFQPRIKFHEKNISELADSIREHGVIQPIVVRKISDKYEIIAGERRYKASVLANKTTIPALIVNLNDQDAAEVALIENVQRQDLTPIEEAVSYKKILDMGMTQEQLASKLGKTQSTVANKLRLLNLDEEVQEALLDQKISERHARSLLKLPTNKDQVTILNRIISERLTVRKTDQVIKEYMEQPKTENYDQIEILDFNYNDEEKENKKDMNENNFNIPNNAILGDQPVIEPQMNTNFNSSIPEVGVDETTTFMNPGFMDVNKIENQAQDIFTEQPKADVENLLNQDASMKIETPQEENHGKFFTMMPESKQNEGFVRDIEKAETNMDFIPQEESPKPQYNFDAFFNNNYIETPKTIEEVSQKEVVQENVASPEQKSTVSQTFGINPEMIQSVQPEQPTMNSVIEPTVSTPVMDTPVENLGTPVNNVTPVSEQSFFSSFAEPTVEPINSTIEEKPVTNFGVDFNPTSQPTVQPSVETPQDLGFNMDFRNLTPNSISEPSVEVVPKVEETRIEPVIPTFNPEPEVTIPNVTTQEELIQPTSNLRMAIEIIRNCSSQLSAAGFNVELEEYDLENMYQVIFKINK